MKTMKLPIIVLVTCAVINIFASEPRGDNTYYGTMDFSGVRYLGHLGSEKYTPFQFFIDKKYSALPSFGIVTASNQEEANILHENIVKKHAPSFFSCYFKKQTEYNPFDPEKALKSFQKKLVVFPTMFRDSSTNYYDGSLVLFSYNNETKKDEVCVVQRAGHNGKGWRNTPTFLLQKKDGEWILDQIKDDCYKLDIDKLIEHENAGIVIMSYEVAWNIKDVALDFAKDVLSGYVEDTICTSLSNPFYQHVAKSSHRPSDYMVLVIPLKKK